MTSEFRDVVMDQAEFAILGGGAMGSIIAAHLARAGCRVVILARGQRAQHLIRDGVRITGLDEFVATVPIITDPAALRRADTLIVATKAIDTSGTLQSLRRAEVVSALSFQNGIMKNELLADAFGPQTVLGALANISGEVLDTGDVLFTRNVNLLMGELDGRISARATQIANALDSAGLHARAVPDIQSLEWSKFVAWVGFVVVALTTRVPTWRYLTDPGAAVCLVRVIRELGRLADACDVPLSDRSILPVATMCASGEEEACRLVTKAGEEFREKAPAHRISTLQDLEAGRPLELEETLGFAIRRAAELGISLPLVEAFYAVLGVMDRSRAVSGRSG